MFQWCTFQQNFELNVRKLWIFVSVSEGEKEGNQVSSTREDCSRIYSKYLEKGLLGQDRVPEEIRICMEKNLADGDIESLMKDLSSLQDIVYAALDNEWVLCLYIYKVWIKLTVNFELKIFSFLLLF